MTLQERKAALQASLAKIEKQIEEAENRVTLWMPSHGEDYFVYAGHNGHVSAYAYKGDSVDRGFIGFGNCFRTYEEAERRAKLVRAFNRCMNVAEAIGMGESERGVRHFPHCCPRSTRLAATYSTTAAYTPFYFPTADACHRFLAAVSADDLKLLLGVGEGSAEAHQVTQQTP